MACLTAQQLASLALGLEGADGSTHVDQCPACQAQFAEMLRITHGLATAHAHLNETHDASRAQLLSRLDRVERPIRTARFSWRRLAMGGLGVSTAAALLLFVIVAIPSTNLSAMERMLSAVRNVTSYSFKSENKTTYLAPDGKPQRIRREVGYTCWRAPDAANKKWLGDLHAEIKSWNRPSAYGEPNNPDDERLSLHVSETYPTGKPGILIVFTAGFYFWTPPVPAGDLPVENDIAKLRAVREGAGKILRGLGTKHINGREARGYVLSFEDAVPFDGFGPVEVWVDPQTDLPIELSYKWIKEPEKYIDEYHITDCQWNIEFPADQFATVTPANLINTTPPKDKQGIAQIVAALKLYAELSGGHYPRVRTVDPGTRRDPTISDPPSAFDGDQIHDKLLRLAGFTGPRQTEWDNDPKYQQIEAADVGLDWLTRVLRDHHHAGYFGDEVGPPDKDKVLLWWCAGSEDPVSEHGVMGLYRVFYGDLRTEVVPEAIWKELVPAASAP